MSSTYLTVAIPYVNAAPHVGYAYELVLADIAARARRSRCDGAVRFLGGTDDHSLKNVLAAERAGLPTRDFVAAHAERFAALAPALDVRFDDFIHTGADERHRPAVERLWTVIADRGDLYRRSYHGEYCVGCEQFYAPGELVAGRCPEHGTEPEHVEEENWFFRLSAYQDVVEHQIASGAVEVTPAPFRSEVLAFVRAGLDDISVSRSARRARGWGIRVPGDESQVVYVWFDALANYISALGYGAPVAPELQRWWRGSDERVHVVGKGILRFHCVYWPAFLAAAGEPAPTRVHVHPYLSLDGVKLSKSAGATVDPVALVGGYGVDALRWWFARDVHAVTDTDFTIERLVARANEDLAGGFGNTVNRISTLVHRLRSGLAPDAGDDPLPALVDLPAAVAEALADFDLRRGTQLLIDALAVLNRDLEATAPWRLADGPALDAALGRHVASARVVAQSLAPVLPGLAQRLADQLGTPGGRLPPLQPAYARLAEPIERPAAGVGAGGAGDL